MITFEDLHQKLIHAGFKAQELSCLPHELRNVLYYRVVRRNGNVCLTNEKLSFHAKVAEIAYPHSSAPETHKFINFDITGEYREDAWAKLEVYSMDWDRGAEQFERIQRELLAAWDGLYGKEQTCGTLPFVLGAADYHEFSYVEDLLSFVTGSEVFHVEIDKLELPDGYYQDYPKNNEQYLAVFYTNITRDKARELLLARGITPPDALSRNLTHVYARPDSREWLPCSACGGTGVDVKDQRMRCASLFRDSTEKKQCQLPQDHEGTHRHHDGKTWFAW